MKDLEDRCSGDCCKAFTLPMSPGEIRERYDSWSSYTYQQRPDDEAAKTKPRLELSDHTPMLTGIHLIYPMVRHLGLFEFGDFPNERREDLEYEAVDAGPKHFYRCVHIEENGDCGIYEIRPQVCREYPYGNPCLYKGCTWKKGRDGDHPETTPPIGDDVDKEEDVGQELVERRPALQTDDVDHG